MAHERQPTKFVLCVRLDKVTAATDILQHESKDFGLLGLGLHGF